MHKRIIFLFVISCLFAAFTFGQAELWPEFESNYRIHPSAVTQTEVFIETSPLDKQVLFSSCNTLTFIPFFVSEGIFVTTDGGITWYGNDTCVGEPLAFHGGDPGITIDKNGIFILTRLGRAPFSGLYSHYSTDNGQTWSVQQVISTDDLERAVLVSDIFPASPYYGRTYASWVKFAPPFPMMISYTDDGGDSWSEPTAINNPPDRSAGGDICIGPEGQVYVCWAGVSDVSPFEEIHAGFASSPDGGTEWNVTEQAFEMNGITGVLTEKGNIRVNGLPRIAIDTSYGERYGWIYVVSGQKEMLPAGSDPDIILNRSTDGGSSWSDGIRVNQDDINNGKIQYFPAVHIDMFGAIDIIYYDDRQTSSDSSGVFLARSTDGGNSWKEYEISDHNYKPEPIGGLGQGYQGDNIDLTSTDTKLWPVWMDNSSGIYQVWTVPVNFSTLDAVEENSMATITFEVGQNHPNPFREETIIPFRLEHASHVLLRIIDIHGKEIVRQLDEYLLQGEHQVIINLDQPGIYFYAMSIGGKTITKKMVVLP